MDDNCDDAEKRTILLKAEPIPGTPHILIAEQQPALQEMLCWMLQLAGYRTTVCADRDATLTWREQALPGDDPALILLDLSLLCATEVADFLSHLRTRWLDAGNVLPQIIVMTTNAQVKTALRQRERVLQKPFHVRNLLILIQQVLPAAVRSEG